MIFLISAILNCEISGGTNVANHDAISDAVGCHGYRRSGHMQYTRPCTADWPGRRPTGQYFSLFNNLVKVMFLHVCQHQTWFSCSLFSVPNLELCALQCSSNVKVFDTHNHVWAETTLCSAPRRRRLHMPCGALQLCVNSHTWSADLTGNQSPAGLVTCWFTIALT